MLPIRNIFLILKLHKMLEESSSLYFNIIIGNIIQLIHDDM